MKRFLAAAGALSLCISIYGFSVTDRASFFDRRPADDGKVEAVPKAKRVLIAMTGLGNRKKGIVKAIYKLEDKRAGEIFDYAFYAYDQVALIEGKDANLQDFAQAIYDFENDPNIEAIDVVMNMHGRPGQICFWEHTEGDCQSIEEVVDLLAQLPSGDAIGPRKLRALYTDACHSESQLDAWLRLGFRVAAGTHLFDINHTGDIRRFVDAWTRGKSFQKAIKKANRPTLWDLGEVINSESDSAKIVRGDDTLTISSSVLD